MTGVLLYSFCCLDAMKWGSEIFISDEKDAFITCVNKEEHLKTKQVVPINFEQKNMNAANWLLSMSAINSLPYVDKRTPHRIPLVTITID